MRVVRSNTNEHDVSLIDNGDQKVTFNSGTSIYCRRD